jgi:hypothetical protein
MTSRSNRPSAQALAAFRCERSPNASRCARVRSRLIAIRSAAWNWFGMSIAQESGRGEPMPVPMLAPSPTRLMASTPQPMPTSIAPAAISPAMR